VLVRELKCKKLSFRKNKAKVTFIRLLFLGPFFFRRLSFLFGSCFCVTEFSAAWLHLLSEVPDVALKVRVNKQKVVGLE
jgi:hypothetical protein